MDTHMKKLLKILITFFIVLLALMPIFFFLIYPQYNNIIINKDKFDLYKITKDITIKILTKISPSEDLYAQEILGISSIEETLLEETRNEIENYLEKAIQKGKQAGVSYEEIKEMLELLMEE